MSVPGLLGTGLAYALWSRGIETLGVSVAFLGLLSPVVATVLGSVLGGQWAGQRQKGAPRPASLDVGSLGVHAMITRQTGPIDA